MAAGLTVTYDQTLADRPITTTDALGGSSSVSYDPDALLAATVTDAAGNTTTAEYDPVALTAATVTDANGTVEHTSYDALAMVTQIALSGPHSEGDTVTDPTSRYSRDLLAWPTSQAPISSEPICAPQPETPTRCGRAPSPTSTASERSPRSSGWPSQGSPRPAQLTAPSCVTTLADRCSPTTSALGQRPTSRPGDRRPTAPRLRPVRGRRSQL